jgi:hypothetical protein
MPAEFPSAELLKALKENLYQGVRSMCGSFAPAFS